VGVATVAELASRGAIDQSLGIICNTDVTVRFTNEVPTRVRDYECDGPKSLSLIQWPG